MKEFTSELSISDFKRRLDDIIVDSEDSAWTRVRQELFAGFNDKFRGSIKTQKFVLWFYHYRWTGIFYPIFYGIFESDSLRTRVRITTRLCETGLILGILLNGLILYGIIDGIVIQENNQILHILRRSVVGLILFSIFFAFPVLVYRHIKKRTLVYLIRELDLKEYHQ